mmetsp:Transcript_16911/g.27670  ORF Transcript_16911/g.27670 Transcript_16911/m.27670 type:complete len:228 (+) Transcript_16911:376-1059(+)
MHVPKKLSGGRQRGKLGASTQIIDERMSSIYADSSNIYWKNGQNRKNKLLTFIVIAILALLAIFGVVHVTNKTNVISQRRSLGETNERHWTECEARVNSRQECTDICQSERNSIQRKTMHQSCLHGCQQGHVASTALGCRGKTDVKGRNRMPVTEEDVFQDVGVLAHEHCSKFQSVDPKPDVFATCRKYHRAGTKQGYRSGIAAMTAVLEEEWESIKAELERARERA